MVQRQRGSGLADAWGVDTICTYFGYKVNPKNPDQYMAKSLCANYWPPAVEKIAKDKEKVVGIASCDPQAGSIRRYRRTYRWSGIPRGSLLHVRDIRKTKSSSWQKVLCVDTIGGIGPARRHPIELSPDAQKEVFGSRTSGYVEFTATRSGVKGSLLHVRHSGKQNLAAFHPGVERPSLRDCLSRGCGRHGTRLPRDRGSPFSLIEPPALHALSYEKQ